MAVSAWSAGACNDEIDAENQKDTEIVKHEAGAASVQIDTAENREEADEVDPMAEESSAQIDKAENQEEDDVLEADTASVGTGAQDYTWQNTELFHEKI